MQYSQLTLAVLLMAIGANTVTTIDFPQCAVLVAVYTHDPLADDLISKLALSNHSLKEAETQPTSTTSANQTTS